jgi:hypothetical protein
MTEYNDREFLAELTEKLRDAAQAVFNDCPEGVDAWTLASNQAGWIEPLFAAHDAELTEKVRNAAIELCALAVEPPYEDAMASDGDLARYAIQHDCAAAIRTLSTTPTPERSNT